MRLWRETNYMEASLKVVTAHQRQGFAVAGGCILSEEDLKVALRVFTSSASSAVFVVVLVVVIAVCLFASQRFVLCIQYEPPIRASRQKCACRILVEFSNCDSLLCVAIVVILNHLFA